MLVMSTSRVGRSTLYLIRSIRFVPASHDLGGSVGRERCDRLVHAGCSHVGERVHFAASWFIASPCAITSRDGGDDVRIGAAAAEIAAHQLADLVRRPAPGPHGAGRPPTRSGPACSSRTGRRRARRRPPAPGAARRLLGEPLDGGDLAASCMTASVRQALMRRPSTSTVQAPHWPWSQPFLVPVRPRCSRRASSSVVQGATASVCSRH